jgi:hypothetical protein
MKKYPVQSILTRADELGIVLWISDGEIQADGPPGTLSDRFREIIASHRKDVLEAMCEPELCCTCLDQNVETPATHGGPDSIMYCEAHRPAPETVCRVCGEQSVHHSPSGHGYCVTHYRCARCGQPPTWKRHYGAYICSCSYSQVLGPIEGRF